MQTKFLTSVTSALVSSVALRNSASLPSNSTHQVPRVSRDSISGDKNYIAPYFPLLGFVQYDSNPILSPNPANDWESAYLYNPSAIVIDDKVFLLYRAQNAAKTSTIGLAWSHNGYNFTHYDQPVLAPTEWYETKGGCEDPRVVRINSTFYMTYTGFDGTTARLCLATSEDLVHWQKHGPLLPDVSDVVYEWKQPLNSPRPRKGWSKSGSILDERQPDGTYRMLFGESFLYMAKSTDLITWTYDVDGLAYAPKLMPWEQGLMEAGPPAIKTRDGKWLQIYNGVATGAGGYTPGQYSTGQLLLDPVKFPKGPPIARLETPLLQPTSRRETEGQVDNVVFTEGLVQYHGTWFMYFGQDDSAAVVRPSNHQNSPAGVTVPASTL